MSESASTRVWAALLVVYVVWGSTYLAIRVAVHPSVGTGLPPLLLAGARFVLAGVLMLAFTARRPAPDGRPDPLGRRQWFAASVIGLALLLGGNGLVSVAEKRIDSHVAALVVGTVPIWAALLGATGGRRFGGGERIGALQAGGLLLGFAGVAVLVLGGATGSVDVVGVLVVLAAALSWAAGSVWSRSAPTVRRPLVMTGMEMLAGGVGCVLAGLATGEATQVHLGAVPVRAWLALGYLVVAGSMLAYTAYVWLLANARLSLVTTYAYVNPLVAVLLGALILHERVTVRTGVAATLIVLGVMLIVARRGAPPAGAPADPPAEAPAAPRDTEVSCR